MSSFGFEKKSEKGWTESAAPPPQNFKVGGAGGLKCQEFKISNNRKNDFFIEYSEALSILN